MMNDSEILSREIDALLNHICELAMMWRSESGNHQAIELEYLDTYNKLRELRWDDVFDLECELPNKNMPKEYVLAHPYTPTTSIGTYSWKTDKAIEVIKIKRKTKNSLLQKLKEWLK